MLPLFHKQNFLKFLVSCTVLLIGAFIYFDITLAFNPLLELCAGIFVALFSVAIMRSDFAAFPNTESRLFFLTQIIVGSVLSLKVLFLTKFWVLKLVAVAVFTLNTYLLGMFMYNFRKWDDKGNGPQPLGAEMNPPLARWFRFSIGLTCGEVARKIHQSAGHGFGLLTAPYDGYTADGQWAPKDSLWAVSDLQNAGVEYQTAEVQYKHFVDSHEDVLFVFPKQLIGKTDAELDEINRRLWETCARMYKDNHACAEKLRAFFDKVFDTVHGIVMAVLSFVSYLIGMAIGFANGCLNVILSIKLFVKSHRAFLRLQRRKLNAFHQGLKAKLVSFRQAIVGKLEAVRDRFKAKAHGFITGYHWLGLYLGGWSILPFWTCISFVLKSWQSEMKFKKRFGMGASGLGSGIGDQINPADFESDEEDFAIQTEPGYVKSVLPKLTMWETLQLGWKGWAIELRKLFEALMGYIKPLLEKLLALLKKLGGIFKRK